MNKPFDLEAVKSGKLAQDGRGNQFRFLLHVPDEPRLDRRVIMQSIQGKCTVSFCENGKYYQHGSEANLNLHMAPEEVELWVNVYYFENKYQLAHTAYNTKAEAEQYGVKLLGYVTTVPVRFMT